MSQHLRAEVADQLRAELDPCATEDQEAARVGARANATFTTHEGPQRPFFVPDRLWRLEVQDAFAVFVLPQYVDLPSERRIVESAEEADRISEDLPILRRGAGETLRSVARKLGVFAWIRLGRRTLRVRVESVDRLIDSASVHNWRQTGA